MKAKITVDMSAIDFNPQFQRALDLMEETHRNVFITGRAGTGKSTLLNFFCDNTDKKAVILAPTGVAAVNVGGQTIHSFFGFKPDVTPSSIRKKIRDEKKNLYKKLETIVIDEISMVRADLLDCVDKFLRLNGPDGGVPFGGVQMIFIGDLYQLPPVVTGQEREIFRGHYKTPYFFGAKVFEALDMEFVELEKIYRQRDDEFIRLLNAIRNRTMTDDDLAMLNQRVQNGFTAPADDFFIYLTSTNEQANRINDEQLTGLKGKTYSFHGFIDGDFGKEYLPTALVLKLKKGAQIMLLNNDSLGQWVNGTVGRMMGVKKDEEGGKVIVARLDNGKKVEIAPYTWEIFRFFLKNGELASEVVGAFTQYPVRLAFAVTIHKSQGKTFERAVIDVGRGTFAHGQMYVALSRCTTLDGIALVKPIRKTDILMDWQVVKFLTRFQYDRSARRFPREEKLRRIKEAIQKKQHLEIVYLKAKDEKSRRVIKPLVVGDMEYNGYPFLGLEALCVIRREKRVFNVDKILEIVENS
ncbi:MAG TPA: AAA family ATPase [Syntrophales bacterium]|nr:AAA family ATPase [Syntrophales bacterium]